ncbi:hypothetical protein V8D89_008507 [Ganoderma adspersum]
MYIADGLTSFIPAHVIDWFSNKTHGGTDAKTHTHLDVAPRRFHSRIAIAWVFINHIRHDEAAWDRFANAKATGVLLALGGYVERVLHKHR